jgi:hypothetical protein
VFTRLIPLGLLVVISGTMLSIVNGTPDTKVAPAEIVTKHLEAIGSADARSKVKGTRIQGSCLITVKEGGTGEAQGQAVFSSQGDMNLFKLGFESETDATWFKFDGSKSSVSQFRPGRRTSLENFFASYEILFKEGLLGGVLTEAWPLLNLEKKNPKLESPSLKEVGGKKLLALKYMPRKGSDLKITLFFDPDTFRHLRTEYSQTIYANEQTRIAGGGGGLPPATNRRASNTRIDAFEEFSDFKEEQGLTLPHTYKFELSIQSEIIPALINWTINFTDFKFSTPFTGAEISAPKG